MTYQEKHVRLLKEPAGGVPDLIDTRAEYDDFLQRFSSASGPIAVDAERASGYRYSQQDWLIQFKREGAGIALIDPVALSEQEVDWQDVNEAFGDAVWIMHDSSQDLPGYFDLGLKPAGLFDTERAARLLGQVRFGLAAVTERYLDLTLAKEHSAADWSYRPLDRDMRIYAALDVEVLIELEGLMKKDLKKAGKWDWAQEDFIYLLNKGKQAKPLKEEPWRGISHINVIDRDLRGLAIARALWTVRDRLAQDNDIAPHLLLQDSAIIEAAQRKPHNSQEFRRIRSLNQRVRVHKGDERDKMFERYAPIQRKVKPQVWKEAIFQALSLPYDQLPKRRNENPETGENAPKSLKYWRIHHPDRYELLQSVRKFITQVSEDTSTPTDIILKPKIVRNLCWHTDVDKTPAGIHAYLLKQGARAWQADLLSESLSSVIM